MVAHTGFEPVVSSLRGMRPGPLDECATKSPVLFSKVLNKMVRKKRFELLHPYGYYTLNVARLPFRHLRVMLC